MPLHSYSTPPDALGFTQEWRTVSGISSQRVEGKLVLRNNPYQLYAGKLGSQKFQRGYHTQCWQRAHGGRDVPVELIRQLNELRLREQCYSKMRGKLYWGSASLGVTLATVKQSREMIANRYAYLTQRAEAVAADLLTLTGNRRYPKSRHLEKLAGLHLEVIFGWTPLLQDIHAAATKVIQHADDYQFVSVSANSASLYQVNPASTAGQQWAGECRVSYSTGVVIKNPNLWLAERAGLLNPATVAWDLVPWSFVVNMFVNTGQLVQSITDFMGLEFTSTFSTTTYRYKAMKWSPYMESHMSGFDQRRAETPMPPKPSLAFRLPAANWGTAAMAASLFTQRFSRIAALLPGEMRMGRRPKHYTE